MSDRSSKEQLFLQWFVEQYDVGLPDPSNISQCLAYLSGIVDANAPDSDRFVYMRMCISTMRSFEVMVRVLRQYEVKING